MGKISECLSETLTIEVSWLKICNFVFMKFAKLYAWGGEMSLFYENNNIIIYCVELSAKENQYF